MSGTLRRGQGWCRTRRARQCGRSWGWLRLEPLYGGDGSAEKAIAALTRASLDVKDSRYTRIEIINPTREAFDDFGTEIVDPATGEVRFGIPSSHLRYRDREDIRSGVNIQDANLLKITYGSSV